MASCYYSEPDRAPDWKWLRVQGIVSGVQPPSVPELDTEQGAYWINRGVAFLQRYLEDNNPLQNIELLTEYSDIYSAFRIYLNEEDTYLKADIEASILARVDPEEIALDSNIAYSAMRAYQALFFDVLERIDNTRYIYHTVIGKDLQNLTRYNVTKLWKIFAYERGPKLLKAIITHTVNPQFCATDDAVSASLQEVIEGGFKVAAAIAAMHPTGGDREQRHLLSKYVQMTAINKLEDFSLGQHTGQVIEHVEAMLNVLRSKFSIGNQNPTTKRMNDPDAILNYRDSATDLTFDEMLEASVTGVSATADEHVAHVYPEVPNKKTNAKGS